MKVTMLERPRRMTDRSALRVTTPGGAGIHITEGVRKYAIAEEEALKNGK